MNIWNNIFYDTMSKTLTDFLPFSTVLNAFIIIVVRFVPEFYIYFAEHENHNEIIKMRVKCIRAICIWSVYVNFYFAEKSIVTIVLYSYYFWVVLCALL